MPLSRYHKYGTPRLHLNEGKIYMIRDVLTEDDRFSGVCEYASFFDCEDGSIVWNTCREGASFKEIGSILPADALKSVDASWPNAPKAVDNG